MRRLNQKVSTLLVVLLLLCLALFSQANVPQSFTGKIVGISEGDTISVMQMGNAVKLRLHDIDCPKWGQSFGIWSQKFTSDLTLGKEITARVSDTDRYGRFVVRVILRNCRSLSYELVGAGMAWWDRVHFPHLRSVGSVAQIGKRGLWADESCVPPWEWRQGNRLPSEFCDI